MSSKKSLTKMVVSFVAVAAMAFMPIASVSAAAPTVSEVAAIGSTNDNTPMYSFYSNQEGTIVYHGACVGDTLTAEAGVNEVTFNQLADGTYAGCAIVVVNADGEFSTPSPVTSFSVDTTAPTLTTVTEVDTPTNNPTPAFEFNSDEAGDITYGGSCDSATASAVNGDNNITFNALTNGTYSDCTVQVTDAAGNESNVLAVNEFVIETSASLDNVGFATAASPEVESARTIVVNASVAGELTMSTGTCSVSPTEIPAGQSTLTLYDLADGVNYATPGTCELTLTADSGVSDTLDVSEFANAGILNVSDTVDPAVTVSDMVVQPNGSTVHVVYTSDEGGTFDVVDDPSAGTCALSGTGFEFMPGTNNESPIADLANGTYGESANACDLEFTDVSGNTTTVDMPEFTIADTSGPTLTVVEGPDAEYANADLPVTFTIQSDEAVTTVSSLNPGGVCAALMTVSSDGAFTANADETITLAPTGDVEQMLTDCTIRVADDLGNLGPAMSIPAFTVDNVAPEVTIANAPGTTSNPYVVQVNSSEAGEVTFGGGCMINDAATANIVSGLNTFTFDPLTIGANSCSITMAEDAAGNTSGVLAFPAVTITDNGDINISGATIDPKMMTLTFTSSEAGTLTFAADSYCTSPTTNIKAGSNTIQLNNLPVGLVVDACEFTAQDIDGNTDTVTLPEFTVEEMPEGTMAYRYFNTQVGSYLYVTDDSEKNQVDLLPEYNFEGAKFIVKDIDAEGMTNVYRFFNTCVGGHIFTISADERASLTANSCYDDEGAKFSVATTESADVDQVFRFWMTDRGVAGQGSVHLFTSSEVEAQDIRANIAAAVEEQSGFFVYPL